MLSLFVLAALVGEGVGSAGAASFDTREAAAVAVLTPVGGIVRGRIVDMGETAIELAYLSTREQIERFHRRSLSPVEVLDAQIECYREVGKRVNAVTDQYQRTRTASLVDRCSRPPFV
jgi:hypothetical protein